MDIWLLQEGDSAQEAALQFKMAPEDTVSALVIEASKHFAFGAKAQILRASQLQILGTDRSPISNRAVLSSLDLTPGCTLRIRPRPHQHASPRSRPAAQPAASAATHAHAAATHAAAPHAHAVHPRGSTASYDAPTRASRDKEKDAPKQPAWSSAMQFGAGSGPTLPATALRSRTQEFGPPPPSAARPTAVSTAKAADKRKPQPQVHDDKPRKTGGGRVSAPGGSAASGSVSAPKPKGKPAKATGAATQERDWAADCKKFYAIHNPEKVEQVMALLESHKGEEGLVWSMMLKRYGVTEDNWDQKPAADGDAPEPDASPAAGASDAPVQPEEVSADQSGQSPAGAPDAPVAPEEGSADQSGQPPAETAEATPAPEQAAEQQEY
eukprot:TRINITY_DN2177_c2_g1_i1.p1 TRINITY_DN2177_c2_g1~~TRINITY_DN2177_c2_g1_i1.p1  ORF type:complete len:421 (+),score=66.86 TRINITY_DN2177_c2_g1_i1:119-1264(+)